jgi:hypothetical protein
MECKALRLRLKSLLFCIYCDVLVSAMDPAISLRVISDGLVMRSERSGYPSHHYPSRFLPPTPGAISFQLWFGSARLVFQSQLLNVSASYFPLPYPGQPTVTRLTGLTKNRFLAGPEPLTALGRTHHPFRCMFRQFPWGWKGFGNLSSTPIKRKAVPLTGREGL